MIFKSAVRYKMMSQRLNKNTTIVATGQIPAYSIPSEKITYLSVISQTSVSSDLLNIKLLSSITSIGSYLLSIFFYPLRTSLK